MTEELRCPSCSRLLAKRDEDGQLVALNPDRSRLVLRDADIECLRCSSVVTVRATGPVVAVVSATRATWGTRPTRRGR